MPLKSPGGRRKRDWFKYFSVTVSILQYVTLVQCDSYYNENTSGASEQTVVVEIGNVEQPNNCSQFLNDLEVRSIYLVLEI